MNNENMYNNNMNPQMGGPVPPQPAPGPQPMPGAPVPPQPVPGAPAPGPQPMPGAPVPPQPVPGAPTPGPQPMYGAPMPGQPNVAPKKKNSSLIIIIAVVAVAAIVLVCVFLLGGGKKLNCSSKSSFSGMEMEQSVEYKFNKKGTKIKTASTTINVKLPSSTSDDQVETVYKSAQEECDEYKDIKGVSCKVSKKDKTIKETVTIDVGKISDADAEKVDLDLDDNYNFDDAKKDLESSGYTCK